MLRRLWRDEGEPEHELIFNGVFLMATYCGGSSAALMTAALADLPAGRSDLRVLIGGLGMGFTLDRALCEPSVRHVTVVEIEPTVVRWNRQYLGTGPLLEDGRTAVVDADFVEFLEGSRDAYDIIVSDIDNGPSWLARAQNARLYQPQGLAALAHRLTPGGVAAFWCHQCDAGFAARLKDFFVKVHAHSCVDIQPTGRPFESFIVLGARKMRPGP